MIRLLLRLSSIVIIIQGYYTAHKQHQNQNQKSTLFSFINFLRLLFAPCTYVGQQLYYTILRPKHKTSVVLRGQRNKCNAVICGLPQELRDEILSHLSISSIVTAKMSCRALRNSGPSESSLWIQAAREVETRFTSVWVLNEDASGETLAEAAICLIFVACLWCELLVPLLSAELPSWVCKRSCNTPQLQNLSKLRRWTAVFELLRQYAMDCGFIQDNKLGVLCVTSKSDFSLRLTKFLVSCRSEL